MVLHPATLFGLYAALSNVSIPLISVNYDVNVKSFAGHITIKQTYKNVESTDLECVYGFPINDQAAIVGLTVTIGNRTLISQFKKKDEAFKEYTEALARNDGAYLLDQSDRSDDTFVLSVGRLPPGKECLVSISYVNTLESVTETKMRLTIPTSLYPRYNPNPSAPQGVAPPENYQATVPYKTTLSGHIEAVNDIQNVSSPTHPLKVTRPQPDEAEIAFAAEQEPLDRDLFIDIEIENNPQHHVEVENTADGKYTALYAFVPHFKKGKATAVNTEIIFVVDCSGSMQDDDIIEDAKRAMQIFLRSIPEGSYFNFYRFGGSFQSLFNQSELYSAESFAQAKDYANATDASLGGTEVMEPLRQIYSEPPRVGFSRQIFLLTDGEVENTDEVIALVRANAANTRLFSFGLGKSPSRSLVNGVAAAGNGKAEFIKDGQDLESIVARQLNRALQPAITDVTLTWEGAKNVQQVPANLPAIFKGDRLLVYAIFERNSQESSPAKIRIQRGATTTWISLAIPSSEEKSAERPFLEKLAARELIKQVENSASSPPSYGYHGSLQTRAPVLTNGQIKEKVTALSLAYGVLSKYVSLVAVENRTAEERANASQTMELREVPIQKSMAPAREVQPASHWSSYGVQNNLIGLSHPVTGGRGGHAGSKSQAYNYATVLYDDEMENVEGLDDIMQWTVSPMRQEQATTNTPVATTISPATQVNRILALQQWNGAWKFSPELTQLTNISEAQVRTAVSAVKAGLSDDVVSTILTVALIESRYPDKGDVWQAIVSKGLAYLEKEEDAAAIANVKTALLALVKSQ